MILRSIQLAISNLLGEMYIFSWKKQPQALLWTKLAEHRLTWENSSLKFNEQCGNHAGEARLLLHSGALREVRLWVHEAKPLELFLHDIFLQTVAGRSTGGLLQRSWHVDWSTNSSQVVSIMRGLVLAGSCSLGMASLFFKHDLSSFLVRFGDPWHSCHAGVMTQDPKRGFLAEVVLV